MRGFPHSSVSKESACNAGDVRDVGLILGGEDPLEKGMQPTLVFLPGESPWTEEPGGLRSIGSQRVRYD